MSFRITMGMKMNTYRYNLMQSTNTLYNAQEKVETHRKFNSYAESPADATNAWRIRRNYMDNDSYIKQNKDTTTRYQTAWLAMGSIKTSLEQQLGKTSIIRAANDPTGEAKEQLGNILSNTAETVVQGMNGAKYGDEFVFGGLNGTDAPFKWEGEHLYYRGIDLTPPSYDNIGSMWPKDKWGTIPENGTLPSNFPITKDDKWVENPDGTYTHTYSEQEIDQTTGKPAVDANGDPKFTPKTDANVTKEERDWNIYFKNVETLDKMSKEVQYADLGMGQREELDENGELKLDENGNPLLVDGTFFNNAIPGINMLGYGVDNDGDSKNLALLFKQFDKVLDTVDSNGNVSDAMGGNEAVLRLMDKFDQVCDFTLKGYTTVDTQAKFLTSNQETLEGQNDNLNEQIVNLEEVDMADAITRFMWDYNCYNASLKIGTQLLSQSLIDYMR